MKWDGRKSILNIIFFKLFDEYFNIHFVRLPTDVQSEAIPLILGGGDVLMAAETGSGKTGAFCLPVLQITWETLKALQDKKGGGSGSKSTANSDQGWRMSVQDRGPAIAISPDGLQVQSRHFKEWHGCRATFGVANKGLE